MMGIHVGIVIFAVGRWLLVNRVLTAWLCYASLVSDMLIYLLSNLQKKRHFLAVNRFLGVDQNTAGKTSPQARQDQHVRGERPGRGCEEDRQAGEKQHEVARGDPEWRRRACQLLAGGRLAGSVSKFPATALPAVFDTYIGCARGWV